MSRLITSDGASIAYTVDGLRGAPLLMLSNSLGTDRRLWDLQMPALTSHFRVLRYDSRGHGESSVPEGAYTLARLGTDALELLDAVGVKQADFCGISLGGMVGQWLSLYAAERLRSLALCNTSAYMGPPETWDTRIATVRVQGMAAIAPLLLQRWFTADFLTGSPASVAAAHDMLLATPVAGYTSSCMAIRSMDLRTSRAPFAVRTLIIGGTYDQATPPAHAQALHAQMPHATLAMLPAAHLSNVQIPQRFTHTLLGFLRA